MFKSIKTEFLIIRKFLKGTFDVDIYIDLNPDVPRTRYKAIRHYFKFGRFENRILSNNGPAHRIPQPVP